MKAILKRETKEYAQDVLRERLMQFIYCGNLGR